MDRDEALALVRERIPNANLMSHCLAVEAIMQALAERLGEPESDREDWCLAGLLHDLDYSETAQDPDRHGLVAAEMLRGMVSERVVRAILSHAEKAPRQSTMDKALYAADPTTGFIVAAALVRPDRSLAAVELKSLKKRWKEKAFARGASREQMATCADLGLERDEFLELSLLAMRERADELGL